MENDTKHHNTDLPPEQTTVYPVCTLSATHLADLEKSGIPLEAAQKLGIYSASEIEVARLLGLRNTVGNGMVIPFYDFQGERIVLTDKNGQSYEFARIRLDNPAKACDANGRPAKYRSRTGSGQHPYIIPDIARQIDNGIKDLILVEGEKKAISASRYGFPAIG